MTRPTDIAAAPPWVAGDSALAADLRAWLHAAGAGPADQPSVCWLLAHAEAEQADALLQSKTGLRPIAGSLVIDATPAAAAVSRARAKALGALGIDCLDLALIPGGDRGRGIAAFAVGCEEGAWTRAQPWLQALARGCAGPGADPVAVVRAGGPGAGRVALDAHRILAAGTAQAVAEALVLTQALQADAGRVAAAMGGGFAASVALARFGPPAPGEHPRPGFDVPVSAWSDALGAALDQAHALGCALPLTALVAQQLNALVGAGLGEADLAVLREVLERMRAPRESRA